jgi:hypothetical protein
MQVSDLTVEVRDANLNRVGLVTPDFLPGFNCVLRYNNIGTWKLELPVEHPLYSSLATAGSGVIVSLFGVPLLSGFSSVMTLSQTQDFPDGVATVEGLDDSVLLRDRLAYPTPGTADVTAQTSAYDVRTGAAETVMKQFVEANMGSLAPTARKQPRFSTEGDFGRGATVKASARFDVLYELLQGLADASSQAGTPIGFDVKQVGSGLVFQAYAPTDRSAVIRMDIANNRLTETTYALEQPGLTRAIVGGGGDGTARTFLERTSTASLAAETAWGRRIERFVDSRSSSDSTALATDGDSALADEGKTKVSASVKPSDDTAMLFGKDWFLGDTVTVVVGGTELKAIVTELGISVEADGVRLYGTVGEPSKQSYEQQIVAKTQAMAVRLNNLERYK